LAVGSVGYSNINRNLSMNDCRQESAIPQAGLLLGFQDIINCERTIDDVADQLSLPPAVVERAFNYFIRVLSSLIDDEPPKRPQFKIDAAMNW
jgi:hypothetical protein